MRTMSMRWMPAAAGLIAAGLLIPCADGAGVPGRIIKKDGGVIPEQGNAEISWFAATREYDISKNNVSTKIPNSQVERVEVAKPANLDSLVAMVQNKQYAPAAGPLKEIVTRYEMLQWDVPAARWLAEAYLNLNMLKEAEDMCAKVFKVNPEAAQSGDLARIYWMVLQKAGKEGMLRTVLSDAVKTGSREVAAVAQLQRADMDRAKGDVKKALIDGYLRTAILFRDVKSAQPEALLKASECFQQLGQLPYAEKMRKRLLDGYPQSPEAQKVRGGA